MARRHGKGLRSHCPINFAVESFGDQWSLLIVRDIAFWGKRTYGDFARAKERIATNILAKRLQRLEEGGIIKRIADPEDGRRDSFQLTQKGLDLIPLLLQLALWSERHDPRSEAKNAPDLISKIRTEPNAISAASIELVRAGGHIFSGQLAKKSR